MRSPPPAQYWMKRSVAAGDPHPVDPVNGYRVQARDLEFLGYSRQQLGWWQRKEAPNGLTPAQFRDFRVSLADALRQDGIPVDSLAVYLKGSSVGFFSNKRKPLPTLEELANQPMAAARLEQWLGDDPVRPRSRLFDAMHRLGLEEPSDVDVVISSDAMVRLARERYLAGGSPRTGFLHPKYQFVSKALMNETFPSVADWTDRWHAVLGRKVTPAVFGSREELLEPKDISPGVRWQIIGPEAIPMTVGSGEPVLEAGRRNYEDVLRISPPKLPTPPESAALRGNQRSEIDRALLRFLDSEVNLSGGAYRLLGERVAEVHQAFTEDPVFSSNENRLQGSCFYGTAIQPVSGRGLDVDVLLELPFREDWKPQRYLVEAERALNASQSCAGAAQRQSRNIRIDFSDDVHVDVVPMVALPSGEKAIVNFEEDAFQPVDPVGIAEWIDQQDERSGGSLRPAVRLLKYANAMDGELPLAPISLTILLGEQIKRSAEITRQTGLTDDLTRLVDGLCDATAAADQKPRIDDPSRPDVNFDHRWKWGDYQQFRIGIHEYRDKLTNALRTDPEGQRPEVWTPVFGKEFAKYLPAADVTKATPAAQQVDRLAQDDREAPAASRQDAGIAPRDRGWTQDSGLLAVAKALGGGTPAGRAVQAPSSQVGEGPSRSDAARGAGPRESSSSTDRGRG